MRMRELLSFVSSETLTSISPNASNSIELPFIYFGVLFRFCVGGPNDEMQSGYIDCATT